MFFSVTKGQRHRYRQPVIQNTRKHMSTINTVELPPQRPDKIKKNSEVLIPKGIMGQLTCHTHPHLITEDCLTGGVTQAEYIGRREKFVSKLVAEVNNPHKTHIVSSKNIKSLFRNDMTHKLP